MDRIRIEAASAVFVVRAGGAVLGETSRAQILHEDGHPPVVYFPQEDVAMAMLERSDKRTTCPFKGEATHWSIEAKSGRIHDAAWSYEAPLPGAEAIARHIAFYPDKATVEEI